MRARGFVSLFDGGGDFVAQRPAHQTPVLRIRCKVDLASLQSASKRLRSPIDIDRNSVCISWIEISAFTARKRTRRRNRSASLSRAKVSRACRFTSAARMRNEIGGGSLTMTAACHNHGKKRVT